MELVFLKVSMPSVVVVDCTEFEIYPSRKLMSIELYRVACLRYLWRNSRS